ncbi:MAG: DUF1232 domain-containing protein [Endomicrobium sp.]|jgi:uncharacterized membrane protein YkvA (DUF1232 family)|nr:DUF1232 domain-containing protein [Endomicrobium sp.]
MGFIKNFFSDAKEGIFVLFYAVKDKRTPLYIKILILAAAAYLVLPVDIIPDWFVPLGLLDDFAIVPSLFYFAHKSLPKEVLNESQEKAKKTDKTVNTSIIALFFAAAAAVILFLILLYLFYKMIF